jgi:hypothetical protein
LKPYLELFKNIKFSIKFEANKKIIKNNFSSVVPEYLKYAEHFKNGIIDNIDVSFLPEKYILDIKIKIFLTKES